ncbi:MAG: DUF58 domain-containing protein [Alphaproteobacteria bacterium]|nr:DUF58 domain-containing protein [Alphaproteobacteria bacterium]
MSSPVAPSIPTNAADRVVRAEAIGEGLPPLLIAAERVAATVAQGVHGRRRIGTGETFWQYRHYATHDSAHAIDWRRSARSDDLYVRETEWEASQSVWLWADHSLSMQYQSSANRSTKAARAALLLLASSAALLRGGERLGLLGVDRRASGGRLSLRSMAERFYAMPEDRSGLPPSVDLPKYSQGLLFSDFLAPVEVWEKRFAEFSEQRVRGLAVQILDVAEETLPFSGRAKFLGMEDEGEFIAEKVEVMRPSYQNRLNAHRDALRQAARAAGWDLLVHHTDRSPEQAMMAIYIALSHALNAGRR